MLEKIILEDKDREQLYIKLEQIAPLKELYYIESKEEGKKFKSPKYKIIAIEKEKIKAYIKEYIYKIGKLMGVETNLQITEENDIMKVNITSNYIPILIGKEGKNIEAIQTLMRQSIYKQLGMRIIVNVDASNYKLRKQQRLEKEIKNIAQEVLNSKIDAKLDPMNAYDRRIVHSIISTYDNLKTESVGEDKNRYVVIKYLEQH